MIRSFASLPLLTAEKRAVCSPLLTASRDTLKRSAFSLIERTVGLVDRQSCKELGGSCHSDREARW